MAVRSYIEAITEALAVAMRSDQRVFVMGEDVGVRGGVFRATAGLLEEFGEERVLDTPLAEGGIVGTAIGAALNGMLPVAEIQFADFILPAVNQILSEAAKIRYRTAGDFHCPIVIRAPYGGGVHGALYHSQCLEALFTHVPGLKVVTPSSPYDAKGLLLSAIRDPDPVLFFEHKRCYRLLKEEVPESDYVVPIGQAAVRREGTDITVFSYGLMMHFCQEAAEAVAADGVSVHLVDLRTLLPLDRKTILAGASRTGKVLIVHEDNKTHGIGAEVAALISEGAFFDLDAPVMRLCGPDVPAMPYSSPMEKYYMLDPQKIADKMRELAAF